MILVTDTFSTLVADDLIEKRHAGADFGASFRDGLYLAFDPSAVPTAEAVRDAGLERATARGLQVINPSEVGARVSFRGISFPDGTTVPRRKVYAVAACSKDEPGEAARQVIDWIADRCGTGRVWIVGGGASYLMYRGREAPRLGLYEVDGVEIPHVTLGAYFAHEAELQSSHASGQAS